MSSFETWPGIRCSGSEFKDWRTWQTERYAGVITTWIAIFAICSALTFEGQTRLLVPLGCLVAMFIVSRVDRQCSDISGVFQKIHSHPGGIFSPKIF